MQMSRREFLEWAAIAGAALRLLPDRMCAAETAAGLAAAAPSGTAPDNSMIRKFAGSLRGRVILRDDPEYDSARRIFSWNPITAKRPAMIVRCGAASDVARAIDFARRHTLEVAVRGGGHDVLGKSVCENGMVIDLSPMKGIAIDPTRRTARVEAGVISDEFNRAAQKFGLAAALGCNPAVGISGLTLGGGLGWLLGRFGSACDNLRSVELVGADGKAIVATADERPDLFWALHGGGGNFGVATAFEFDLYPVTHAVGGFLVYPREQAREFYRFYHDHMRAAPDELAVETSLDSRGMTAMVCYSGGPGESDRILKPLLSFGRLLQGSLQPMPYIEFPPPPLWNVLGAAFQAEWESILQFGRRESPPSIYWKGGYLTDLSDAAIELLVESTNDAPAGWSVGLGHYMHGQVCRVTDTPLIREPNGCSYFFNQGWHDPARANAAIEWVDRSWRMLQPFSGGKNYINYLSVDDESDVARAYGANYPRLVELKTKYDPTNLFHLNRNIRPRTN